MKYLSNINLLQNELQNARIQNLATNPTNPTPVKGQIYFNSVSNQLLIYSGNDWEVVGKDFTGGTYITVDGTAINHDNTTRTDTTSAASPGYGQTFTVVDSVTTNATGHITAINVKTITMPAEYVHPAFDGDDIDIDTGALTGATVISDLDFNITTNEEGHVTDANATIATRTLTLGDLGFTGDTDANNKEYNISAVTASGGALVRLADSDAVNDDVKLASGTQINVSFTDADTITFNHADVTRSDGTSAASPAFAGTFDVISGVTSDARGHITAVNVKTVTVPTETQLSIADASSGVFFNSDPTVSNHAITFSRSNTTQATVQVGEFVVSTAGSKTGNLTVGGNAVITGNLTVNGTTTTLDTETVLIKDNIIEINSTQTGTPASSLVSGIEINRGSQDNFQFVFVEQTDDFRLGKVGGTFQPVLTRDEVANLAEGDILVYDATGKKAVGKTLDELLVPSKFVGTLTGDGEIESFVVPNSTHLIGNKYMTIAVYEVSTGEQVFVNTVVNQSTFAVSFNFAVAPAVGKEYEFVLIG